MNLTFIQDHICMRNQKIKHAASSRWFVEALVKRDLHD